MKKAIIITLLLFPVLLTAQSSGSAGSSDARSSAMGKTYTASSRGVFSLGTNPANLMFSENRHFELGTVLPLPNLDIKVGTDFLSIDDFNYFFCGVEGQDGSVKGRELTESDKERLMSLFEGGGLFEANLNTSLLSFTYKISDKIGAFGFGINDVVSFRVNFPQDMVSIALYGNPSGRVYNFNDAEVRGWWLRSYSLSYARDLPEIPQRIFEKLSAGITLKIIHGYTYVGTDHVNSTFTTGDDYRIVSKGDILAYSSFSPDFSVDYDFDTVSTHSKTKAGLFPNPAGKGIGVDLGFSARMNEYFSFGLAITDMGSIKWTEQAAQYYSTSSVVLRSITDDDQVDSLKKSITGKGQFIDGFNTPLPTALRMGVLMDLEHAPFIDALPGKMMVALDYNQGFNNQPGNSTTPRFSLGAEWDPGRWMPNVRSGFSFGGLDKFSWAFGLGINAGVFEFNIASPDFHYLFMANSAKRISFAMGTRWIF